MSTAQRKTKWNREQKRWLNRDVWQSLRRTYAADAAAARREGFEPLPMREVWRQTVDFMLEVYQASGTWPDCPLDSGTGEPFPHTPESAAWMRRQGEGHLIGATRPAAPGPRAGRDADWGGGA